MRGLAYVVFAAGLVAAATQMRGAGDVAALAARVQSSVVAIHVYNALGEEIGQGSGFVLADGRVATNAHVLRGGAWAKLVDADGSVLGTATYAESLSDRLDVAILPRPPRAVGGLPLESREPPVGTRIVVIGAPLGLANTVTDGLVSGYRDQRGQRLLQMSAPIADGSSGGPVLDLAGRVVGMTVGSLEAGQSLNLAVRAADVLAVAARPPALLPFPGGQGRTSVAARVRDAGLDVRAIGPGEDARGRLEWSDLRLDDGSYADVFLLRSPRGERVLVELRSSDFDAYLFVVDTADGGAVVAEDDDGAGGTDARVEVDLPAGGALFVVVSSHEPGATGSYRLEVSEGDGRWMPVYASDGAVWSFDRRTRRRTGENRYRAWIRARYDEVQDADGDAYDLMFVDFEFDCGRHRLRVHAVQPYLGPDPVEAERLREPTEWYDVVPETGSELLWAAVCGSGP